MSGKEESPATNRICGHGKNATKLPIFGWYHSPVVSERDLCDQPPPDSTPTPAPPKGNAAREWLRQWSGGEGTSFVPDPQNPIMGILLDKSGKAWTLGEVLAAFHASQLWTCSDCGFGMDACHVTDETGAHDCPACAEIRLESELTRSRAALLDAESRFNKYREDVREFRKNDAALMMVDQTRLQELRAALLEMERQIPATFFADRKPAWRLRLLVEGWQKAILVNQQLEARVEEMERQRDEWKARALAETKGGK